MDGQSEPKKVTKPQPLPRNDLVFGLYLDTLDADQNDRFSAAEIIQSLNLQSLGDMRLKSILAAATVQPYFPMPTGDPAMKSGLVEAAARPEPKEVEVNDEIVFPQDYARATISNIPPVAALGIKNAKDIIDRVFPNGVDDVKLSDMCANSEKFSCSPSVNGKLKIRLKNEI